MLAASKFTVRLNFGISIATIVRSLSVIKDKQKNQCTEPSSGGSIQIQILKLRAARGCQSPDRDSGNRKVAEKTICPRGLL